MFDDVLDSRVLANAAHADAVRVVAPEVLHKDVAGVGLRSEAIVTNVDTSVRD